MMAKTDERQMDVMQARADAYGFYRRLFQTEADEALVKGLRGIAYADDGSFGGYFTAVASRTDAEIAQELRCDFARLFLGMSKHPVAPYESVFMSEYHLLMQEQRDEVLAVYRREGLSVEDGFGLPEDHLAVELGFMESLCRRSAHALAAHDDDEYRRLKAMQCDFIRDHLARWVPLFASEVRMQENGHSSSPSFYGTAAQLLEDFIGSDMEWADTE